MSMIRAYRRAVLVGTALMIGGGATMSSSAAAAANVEASSNQVEANRKLIADAMNAWATRTGSP